MCPPRVRSTWSSEKGARSSGTEVPHGSQLMYVPGIDLVFLARAAGSLN